MPESPFDQLTEENAIFSIPQYDDILQSILNEIGNFRLLSCVTGFPKSGKSFFADRLKNKLRITTLLLRITGKDRLSQALHAYLAAFPRELSTLAGQLKQHKRVVLIIDNAHLLDDEDFAVLSTFYTLAAQHRSLLQVVLIGNGEIAQRFSKPENRTIFNMLGNIWSLPKLTREQGVAFVRFVLDSTGISNDIIPDPNALVKQAGGSIGLLRTLTATIALASLSGQDSHAIEHLLDPDADTKTQQYREYDASGLPVQEMAKSSTPWVGRLLLFVMVCAVGFFLAVYFLLPANNSLTTMMNSGHKNIVEATLASRTEQPANPDKDQVLPAPTVQKNPAVRNQTQPVMTPVFRRIIKDGPYSVHIGTYPATETLLLALARFRELEQPMFWNKTDTTPVSYELYAGRFDNFSQARQFAIQHQQAELPIVFRPFLITVGPFANEEQIHNAALKIGFPEASNAFLYNEIAATELQVSLKRTKDEAVAECKATESRGLTCMITQYE